MESRRRIIVSNLISIDGFFAGPKGELDWFSMDREFDGYAVELLNSVDTILFGRVTYEFMASYWPTATAPTNDPAIIEKMNGLPKVVFSKTLKKAAWNNSVVARGDIVEEVEALKLRPGRNMVIFGSGRLVSSLTNLGLIDDYQLLVQPVILGNGRPQFEDLKARFSQNLWRTRLFHSGAILLRYQPNIKTLTLIRVFDARRDAVFRAWTDSRRMAAWWGPKMFTNPLSEIDARPGGAIRIDMRGPDGVVYPMTGVFHEVDAPGRLVFTSRSYEDAAGRSKLEVLNTATFAAAPGGKTKLVLRAVVVKAEPELAQALAGMEQGWSESLDKLAGLLAKA